MVLPVTTSPAPSPGRARSTRGWRLALIVAGLALPAWPTTAAAQAPLALPQMPVFKDIPGAHEMPDPALDYKVVFDIQSMPDTPAQLSPALRAVATLINTFRRNGVPADHLHFTAVFHGKTIALVTDDATYKIRTGAERNPNAELLTQLKAAGLVMAVCGQSALDQHYDFKSILPLAQINYSATVTFINLQTRGYVRINE